MEEAVEGLLGQPADERLVERRAQHLRRHGRATRVREDTRARGASHAAVVERHTVRSTRYFSR